MKKILIYICCLIIFGCQQKEKSIVGNWKFHSVELSWDGDKESMENAIDFSMINGEEVFARMFRKMEFEFRDDGTYTSNLGKKKGEGTFRVANDTLWLRGKGSGDKEKQASFHFKKDTLILDGIEGAPLGLKFLEKKN